MKIIVLVVLFILTLTAGGQTILYKPGDSASLFYINAEDGNIYADEVSLRGSRLVGTLRIPTLAPFAGSVTSDITAYLYAGDDFGGFPGTLLWSSNRNGQVFSGLSTAVFANIDTFVPGAFYWGVRYRNIHKQGGDAFGALFAVSSNAVPTNSTGKRYAYSGTGDFFNADAYIGVDSTLAVTIEEGIIPTNPTLDIVRAIAISFLSGDGTNYLAQYTTNLQQGFWYDLGPVQTGTGSTLFFHDNTPDVPNRSYRLLAP